jgi:hypothetical protein
MTKPHISPNGVVWASKRSNTSYLIHTPYGTAIYKGLPDSPLHFNDRLDNHAERALEYVIKAQPVEAQNGWRYTDGGVFCNDPLSLRLVPGSTHTYWILSGDLTPEVLELTMACAEVEDFKVYHPEGAPQVVIDADNRQVERLMVALQSLNDLPVGDPHRALAMALILLACMAAGYFFS